MLSFIVAIGIGWWFGGLLDRWLQTSPWCTAIFLVFGVAAGALNVIRTVRRAIAPRPPGAPGDRGIHTSRQ
jgi:F0F1-type ATP synthase assembly protein I